jgi:hypothetical protein
VGLSAGGPAAGGGRPQRSIIRAAETTHSRAGYIAAEYGNLSNNGRPNVLIVEEDFLFVKYYGHEILLRFRKLIFIPEACTANYIPLALFPVSSRILGLINSFIK